MTEPENIDRAGLAAEYVLGTLDEAEKARAEALIRGDRAFAIEVEQWQNRFDPLLNAIPAEAPPAGALDGIFAAISGQAAKPGAEIIELRRKASAWKLTAYAAAAIAASLIAFVVVGLEKAPMPPQFVAVLESADRTPAFVATADLAGGGLLVRRVGPEPAPGRSFELWAIRDGAPPQSLGVVDRVAEISAVRLAERTGGVPLPKILLAITDEQFGGSLTGKPGGAPIFSGKLIQAPSL